jgi:hypothetical protein
LKRYALSVLLVSSIAALASPAIASQGTITGHVVVAGTNSKGEISTGVFLVPTAYQQPLTVAQTLERALRLQDPSGRFEFDGLPDGEYLVALENLLLEFADSYSDSVRVQVGPDVVTLPAQRVRLEAGRQDRPVIFRATPATAGKRPPPIAAPAAGQGAGESIRQGEAAASTEAWSAPSGAVRNRWLVAGGLVAGSAILLLVRRQLRQS